MVKEAEDFAAEDVSYFFPSRQEYSLNSVFHRRRNVNVLRR